MKDNKIIANTWGLGSSQIDFKAFFAQHHLSLYAEVIH